MQKLYAILITKNDHAILNAWMDRHAKGFDAISVVDGSDGGESQAICAAYPNILYRKDPPGLITDQTLRHAAMESLRSMLKPNDWIFIAHPDEFLLHHPRQMMHVPMPLVLWLPLVVLPHPSERELALSLLGKAFNPSTVFQHYWWRQGQLPHCEFRMFRLVQTDQWDLKSEKKSTTVIPPNFAGLPVCNLFPLYFHYKIYDLDVSRYRSNGLFVDSGLGTGLNHPVSSLDDLFFDEHRIWGDGYQAFERQNPYIFKRFGNPPHGVTNAKGEVQIMNDDDLCIHR
jgi:hypothetical protein